MAAKPFATNGIRLALVALAVLLIATPAPAIDYGTPVPDGKYPAVGLLVVTNGAEQSFLGTGTLIRSNVVITAAHVIQLAPSPQHITFTASLGGREFHAKALVYRTHPGYLNLHPDSVISNEERSFLDTDMLAASSSDLALVLLDHSAPDGIAFPKLATETPVVGTDVTAVGFGVDQGKRGGHPHKRQGILQYHKKYEGTLLFRTPQDSSQRTDHGDSGGPLFLDQNGEEKIAAITHGFYTAAKVDGLSPDEYGIYVSIADRHPWISDTAEQLASYKPPAAPAYYLLRTNQRTPFMALTARQLFSLANSDTPIDRLVGRAFQRGLNEPVPGDIATGWQKRYQLPPGVLVPLKTP